MTFQGWLDFECNVILSVNKIKLKHLEKTAGKKENNLEATALVLKTALFLLAPIQVALIHSLIPNIVVTYNYLSCFWKKLIPT